MAVEIRNRLAFIVGFAVLGCMAFGQALSDIDRVVIVGNKELSPQMTEWGRTLKSPALVEKAVKNGYVLHAQNGRPFLFSKELWAEDAFKRVEQLYAGLEKAVDAKGYVQATSPAVQQFIQNSYGAGGHFANAGTAQFALGNVSDLVLSDGTKQVHLTFLPEADPDTRAKLGEHPLEPGNTKGSAPDGDLFAVPVLRDVHLDCFGKDSMDPGARARDLRDASAILAERYKEATTKLSKLHDALVKKGGRGFDADEIDGLERGMSADKLPGAIGASALNHLIAGYQRFGFGSDDEARAFFGRSQLIFSTSSATLMGMTKSPDGSPMLIMIGIPKP